MLDVVIWPCNILKFLFSFSSVRPLLSRQCPRGPRQTNPVKWSDCIIKLAPWGWLHSSKSQQKCYMPISMPRFFYIPNSKDKYGEYPDFFYMENSFHLKLWVFVFKIHELTFVRYRGPVKLLLRSDPSWYDSSQYFVFRNKTTQSYFQTT